MSSQDLDTVLGEPRAKECFNPNIIPAQATPEGHAGAYAGFYLPTYGYWFKSGQILTFLTGELPQKHSSVLLGKLKPDNFQKDCCSCDSTPWAANQAVSPVT